MAQALGQLKQVKNGRDVFGGKNWGVCDYIGPTSYVQGGDGPIPTTPFSIYNTILNLNASGDQSNTYIVIPIPVQNNITTWRLVWRTAATGVEVTAGTNLSAFTIRLEAIGF